MNNKSSFNDIEILGTLKMTEKEYSDMPLTEEQVLEIAKCLASEDFINDRDKILALKYVAKLCCEALFYINHVDPNIQKKYKEMKYNVITDMCQRVLATIYSGVDEMPERLSDEELQLNVDYLLSELKSEKKESMVLQKEVFMLEM